METFGDVAGRWLSTISPTIKSSTYAGYASVLELHILPYLGNRSIKRLKTADFNSFTEEKLKNGRADGKGGLSAKTVRDLLSVINTIMDYACNEMIISNRIMITYPKADDQRIRILSRQEQSALEMVLKADTDIHKLGILLCLYTGLRIGEICALRWMDFSSEFDSLSVRQTLQRIKDITEENGKTKIHIDTPRCESSIRSIPIPRFLSKDLKNFALDGNCFFLSTDNLMLTEPRTMQNHFARCVKAAGISNANFHSIRHTFGARCIEAGVDVKTLSEIMGHASVNMTINRYVLSSFEQKRDELSKLESYVGKCIGL